MGKARLSGFLVQPCTSCNAACQKLWFRGKFRFICRSCAFGVDFNRLWYNQTHHADHDSPPSRFEPSHCAEPCDHPTGTSSDDVPLPPPDTTLTGGGLQPYTKDNLGITDIYTILRTPDPSKLLTVPPVKPRAGETYVIECSTFEDWACDQYQWVHIGKNNIKTDDSSIIVKNYYHIRVPGFKQGKGRARPNSCNKFKRCSYYLDGAPKRILVSYHGDEKIYVPLAHGNSKKNDSEYVRSCKSLLNELKQSDDKPMKVYRDMASKPGVTGEHHGVLNPRNLKQIKNHQAVSRSEKTLGKDDIYNLIQLAHHLEGFIAEITVFPDLLTIFALPELISTFVELLQSNASAPICLVYDTTFNLGDFYVSPLVFKHVLFEETPWIPLAFLIHERKLQKCHNRLFEYLSDRIPILKNKRIPFITDREPALTKSVEKFFPNMQVLHCWNHLKRDFKEELRKQGANPSESSLYLSHWRQMAQCQDETEFLQTYDELTAKWSESVKRYFDKHMKDDLLKYSGRWIIETFSGIYDPYSGVTNNPSESINAVLKRLTGWQELPVDCMVLSLYHLQNFYHVEIQRGRASIGNYRLKSRYRQAMLDKDELVLPNRIIKPEEIIEYVKSARTVDLVMKPASEIKENEITVDTPNKEDNDKSKASNDNDELPIISEPKTSPLSFNDITSESPLASSPEEIKPQQDKNISQKSLARYVLDNNGVTHVPQCEAFVVQGNNKMKYCVTLNPEKCACPSSSLCYHIIAVRMFVGLPVEDNPKEVNLRSLSKRSLKRSDKKSGRKRPRQNDVDRAFTPAPDSAFVQKDNDIKATCKTPKSKKKLRFTCASPTENSLPAKKRKISFPLKSPDSWVGGLTIAHKEKIVSNEPLCSDIINYVQTLLRIQHPDINGLQNTGRAPVWCDNSKSWQYALPFTNVLSPAAQIHHNGKFHWVVSASLNGHIYVFDSLSTGKLSPSLQIQIASLYRTEVRSLPVQIPPIQQQTNNVDCGLHAIANLVEFCSGSFVGHRPLQFNERYLRDHLVYCIERHMMTPFPRVPIKKKAIRKKKVVAEVNCDCRCGKPNCFEAMIGCDGRNGTCNVWRHKSCTDNKDAKDDWFCTPHRNK